MIVKSSSSVSRLTSAGPPRVCVLMTSRLAAIRLDMLSMNSVSMAMSPCAVLSDMRLRT